MSELRELHPDVEELTERARRYLAFLVSSRHESLRNEVTVGMPWPPSLAIAAVPWRTRTRNCLIANRIDKRPSELPYLTFGDLLSVPAMGAQAVLDFSCTLEAAIGRAGHGPATVHPDQAGSSDASASDSLLDALDEPWSSQISERDRRFSVLLPSGQGTIAERIDALTGDPGSSVDELFALARSIPPVRARVSALATLSLEVALAEYIGEMASIGAGKRLEGLLARLQCDGRETPVTLEAAGSFAGVTRERMRQLQHRFEERLPTHPVVMPPLDRALEVLSAKAPIDSREASEILNAERICSRTFHPASILAAAQLCGRNPRIEIVGVGQRSTVVPSDGARHAEETVRIANRLARSSGIANTYELTAVLGSQAAADLSESDVHKLLLAYSDVEFLDGEWFWSPKAATDPIGGIARKMLSVTSPLNLTSIREGIRRQYTFRRSTSRKSRFLVLPPRNVLGAYFNAHPDFVLLADGTVKPVRPLDYRIELGTVERVMVDTLRSVPTFVLDRTEVSEGCLERGIAPKSVGTMLSYSPVIEHLGTGLWTLRGCRPDPAAVESIRRANALRPRQQRIVDYGWTPEGELWISVRVPRDFGSHVFGIPGAVKRFIAGRDFVATDSDGVSCGRVRIYEHGQCAGCQPFLVRAGVDEGDLLLLRFNLSAESVILDVADEESLDDAGSSYDPE